MSKRKKHFANGLLSELRKEAVPASTDLVKKAVKESKKFILDKPLFSAATIKKAKKALNF